MVNTNTQEYSIIDSLVLKNELGELDFIHLTYYDCIESILKDGFTPKEECMGDGVYCVNLNDHSGIRNLRLFSSRDMYEGEDKVGIVFGKYSGKYTECIGAKEDCFKYNIGFCLLEEMQGIKDLYATIIDKDDLNSYLLNLERKAISKSFLINI